MPLEIERKFLVASVGWRDGVTRVRHLRQGYLTRSGRASVRVRVVDGREAWITVKSTNVGPSRMEFEYAVPVADGEQMLQLCGSIIEKVRHDVPHAGHVWEIDVFAGANAGLVLAEVELDRHDAEVAMPHWLGPEVTGDRRYYNSGLAERPFTHWPIADQPAAVTGAPLA